MAGSIIKNIDKIAKAVILEKPDGIRYTDIVAEVKQRLESKNVSDVSEVTIGTVIPGIPDRYPNDVYKPKWGLYAPIKSNAKKRDAEQVAE